MKNKVYVGNLSLDVTKEELEQLFASSGTIKDVTIMRDRDTGRSKGFGFITFATRQEANNAVASFNGQEFMSNRLRVNMAQEKHHGGSHARGGNRRRF